MDKLGLSARAAGKYIDSPRGARLVSKVEKRAPSALARVFAVDSAGSAKAISSPAMLNRAKNIAARQRQVAGRYAAGGIGLGTLGMYNNRSSSARRGGPAPMTRARPGSGRNP
jgi:hypothetical protein